MHTGVFVQYNFDTTNECGLSPQRIICMHLLLVRNMLVVGLFLFYMTIVVSRYDMLLGMVCFHWFINFILLFGAI